MMSNVDFAKQYKEIMSNLSDAEQETLKSIMEQLKTSGQSDILDDLKYRDFEEVPVDISTFLHDKRYLGSSLYNAEGKFTLFPFWEKTLKEIFPDNVTTAYNTLILTGGIGIGKTQMAICCMLYMLYRLLCLKDPYIYYGLMPNDKLSIAFVNITLENAKGVAMDKMNQMILASEWFMAHGEMSGISNYIYRPNNHIELVPASSNRQIIGRCVFCAFEDEVDFSMVADVMKAKKKMTYLISQVEDRLRSRFLRGTYLPTLNIIASSKSSEQAFLESYIEQKQKNESSTTLIIDQPQWIVDSRKDSKEKFMVAVGDKLLANEVLPLNATQEMRREYIEKGYRIVDVPIGYYERFLENVDLSLQNIAGIATAATLKFISNDRWKQVKTAVYENPFIRDQIQVGTAPDDHLQYWNFFDMSRVSREMKSRPLYVHLDMSKKGDKTGIAGVWAVGKRPTIPGQDATRTMYYRLAFSVSIEAPKGYEISFDKNRAFIRWLREQGFNVKGVSSDTFQSAQLQQQLLADNFNAKIISVDRLDPETHQCLPYAYFKNSIYERRIEVYRECDLLTEEVLGLEREADGHINHPEGGTQGSKDQADAVCGALWNAAQHIDEFVRDYGELLDAALDAQEEEDSDEDRRQQMIEDFQEELLGLYNEAGYNVNLMRKKQIDYVDTGDDGDDEVTVVTNNQEFERKRSEYESLRDFCDGIIIT